MVMWAERNIDQPPHESQSKPGIKMVDPEPCKEIPRRISATIYGCDCSLLTFIDPRIGFEQVAHMRKIKKWKGLGDLGTSEPPTES